MLVYGVANNNPHTVANFVQEWKKETGQKIKTQFFGFEKPEIKKGVNVLLVPTASLLTSNMKMLKSKAKSATVFVFDNPVVLDHLGVTIIDVFAKDKSFSYRFKPLNMEIISGCIEQSRETQAPNKETFDLLPKLLDSLKGSLSRNVLSFIYSVRYSDRRVDYYEAITNWLMYQDGTDVLSDTLVSMKANKGAVERLVEFLNSEEGIRAKAACKEIGACIDKNKTINYKSLTKKYDIPTFDLKYIVSQARAYQKIEKVNKTTKQIYDERAKHRINPSRC